MKKSLLLAAMALATGAMFNAGAEGYTGSSQNAHWLEYVNDDAYVANLLLPGAHDSFTGESWAQSSGSTFATTQTKTVNELWDLGIRVFDIRPGGYAVTASNKGSEPAKPSEVGDLYTYSYTTSGYLSNKTYKGTWRSLYNFHSYRSSLSIESFFDKLKAKLTENPSEFAILHVYKQGSNAAASDLDNTDFDALWTMQMDELYNEGFLVEFKRDLTVGEMRGKILIICRENFGYATHPEYNTYFYGWSEDDLANHKIYAPANYRMANLYVQDIANVDNNRTTEKQNLMLQLINFTKSKDHKRGSQLNWIFNFATAFNGTIANSSQYKSVAKTMNLYVYNQLGDSRSNARRRVHYGDKQVPSGIIMMDYIGDSEANGDKAIQAIVSSDFQSQNVTGVEDIDATEEAAESEVIGYYNLSGQRIDQAYRGQLVIVKYANGSAKKVVL